MKIFIDESGDFRCDVRAERVSVVVGVAIPAGIETVLVARFNQLRHALGFGKGEIKSRALSVEGRRQLCRLLDDFRRVRVRPIILDVTHFQGAAIESLRLALDQSLRWEAVLTLDDSMRSECAEVRARLGRLTDPQLLKTHAWANCIDRTLREACWEVVPDSERDAWGQVEVVVDGQPGHSETREGLFFRQMLINWMVTWSRMMPFGTLARNNGTHPLLDRFRNQVGIDIERLVEQGLRFRESHREVGIQIADVAASIVRKAALKQEESPEDLQTFGWLAKAFCFPLNFGIGLVTPFMELSTPRAAEYEPMIREADLAEMRQGLDAGFPLLDGPYLGDRARVMEPAYFRRGPGDGVVDSGDSTK